MSDTRTNSTPQSAKCRSFTTSKRTHSAWPYLLRPTDMSGRSTASGPGRSAGSFHIQIGTRRKRHSSGWKWGSTGRLFVRIATGGLLIDVLLDLREDRVVPLPALGHFDHLGFGV